MTPALALTQVDPERRPGATLDSTATRAWRGGQAGTLRVRRAYRPCLLTWVAGEPTQALVERMRRAATEWDPRSRLVSLDGATQILLLSEESPEPPNREQPGEAIHSVVAAVRALRPEARIHAVVGDRMVPGERLGIAAARLRRLSRSALASPGDELVWARRYSLASLLDTLDPGEAMAFVEEQLADLRAYDREHGTNLQLVLELALDHHDRNTAASAAFMHRNTFRRQLGRALELVGADLADPWERLALHVALKLRSRAAPSAPRR
jgi:sugar diacid utilization regulator